MNDQLTNIAIAQITAFVIQGQTVPPALALGLYVNNLAPGPTFQFPAVIECSAPGYARVPLLLGNWSGTVQNAIADFTYPPITFGITGPGNPPQTVFGHFYVDTKSNEIWWAQLWATPWVIPPVVIQNPVVYPTWLLQQCPP